eukprot:scaffold202_cov149-Skeletonema_marinoi.AAC.7
MTNVNGLSASSCTDIGTARLDIITDQTQDGPHQGSNEALAPPIHDKSLSSAMYPSMLSRRTLMGYQHQAAPILAPLDST